MSKSRANDIAEAEAVASMMAEFNSFVAMISGDEVLWDVWSRGGADYDSLGADEKARFAYLVNYVFNIYEMSFTYIENELVDEHYVRNFTRDFCELIERNDGVGRFWQRINVDRGRGARRIRQYTLRDCAELAPRRSGLCHFFAQKSLQQKLHGFLIRQ